MVSWKARGMHFPATFLLLLMAFCNASAAATESVGLEDDEDNYIVGSFYVEFHINVSCNTGNWYSENIGSLTYRLQNDIADGIRRDCEECPFENDNLEQIAVSCSEHKLYFRANIQEWASSHYPVTHILRKIEERFNRSGEDVAIMTNSFTSADDLEGRGLSLVPKYVSTQYTATNTMNSGSGEGITVNEVVISTEFKDSLSDDTDTIGIPTSDSPRYDATVKGARLSGCTPVSGSVSLLILLLAVLSSMFVKLLH